MSESVTQLLTTLQPGDAATCETLLSQVYHELRCLAARRLSQEKPGQTLQPTALVHEAYLRLVGGSGERRFVDRQHFFAAAAEAMRRILVDRARAKLAEKRGGNLDRIPCDQDQLIAIERPAEVIAVNDALSALAIADPLAAELVKLHYFAGFSLSEAGETLGLSRASAYRKWAFARAWLRVSLAEAGFSS